MWYVYLIENTEGIYYCGITKDIFRRLKEHNGELPGGAKFTKRGRPWTMLWATGVITRSDALKLESKVKKTRKSNKLAVLKDGNLYKQ